ncbi:MAG: hypothetical protein HGA36_02180 [Candidatus Moranbacteria bacterium]|nr:hypothetical protein [Candidatus Moranbacteria bacterium]
MKKTLISKLTTITLAVLVVLPVLVQKAQAAADATIYINPATISANAGSDFSVDVLINPLDHYVTNADLYFTYDQSKFTLTSITASATFNTPLGQSVPVTPDGTGSYSASTTFGAHISAITTYATLNFHAVAAVTDSPITITNSTMVYADNSPTYPADAGTNVVGTRTSGAVTVTVPVDAAAPVLSAATPSGALATGTTQATVGVNATDATGPVTCKYSTTSGTYDSYSDTFGAPSGSTYSFLATGLVNGGSYGYFVRCQDAAETPNVSNELFIAFSVANPVIKNTSNNDDDDSSHKSKKEVTKPRTIKNSKKSVKIGQILTQRGKKFSKNTFVNLYFSKFGGTYYAPVKIKTSSTGSFMLTYKVNKQRGTYSWYAVDTKTGKSSRKIYYKVK